MREADGAVIMHVLVSDGEVTSASGGDEVGQLSLLAALLSSAECIAPRILRLINAERELGIGSYAVRVALVVCQVAEEFSVSSKNVSVENLRHSRVINHSIGFTRPELVERAVDLLSENDLADVLACSGFDVSIGNAKINLDEACSFDERERDHDRRGLLNVPKLGHWARGPFHVRVGAVKLKRGLGTQLGTAEPYKSYFVRGKQNTLNVVDGKFYGHVEVDFKKDWFFFPKLRRVDVGLEQVGLEMRDGRSAQPLEDAIIDGLLGGGHGTPIARWIWAMIDSGAVFITPDSARRCFFGSRTKTRDDGHVISGPIAGRAVGECVVYYNIKTERIYVDKYNVGMLMEVVAPDGELAHLKPASDAKSDRSNLRECYIAEVNRFCCESQNCPLLRTQQGSSSYS